MRRMWTSFAVLGSTIALVAGTAFAGDYHFGQNLVCQDCHVMHYSQSHGYNANGSGNFTGLGAAGPYEYLLRNDVNDLCMSCHDGQAFAPDVVEAHGNGYLRQAGALNVVGGNGQYPPTTGHTLGSTAVAPGGTWSNAAGLECVNCHSPHGRASTFTPPTNNGGYRNLYSGGTLGGQSISYSRLDADGSNDLTRWVFEDASSGTNANHYGQNHITFNEPDATKSAYAQFCKSCHTNFHGDVGGSEIGGVGSPPIEFHRHPASTAKIGALGGGHSQLGRLAGNVNQTQVLSPTGVRAGSYNTQTDLTPSCMSCHKAHGNQNAFGLIYMLGTGTMTEQGDSGVDMRNTCRQCHSEGGSGTGF